MSEREPTEPVPEVVALPTAPEPVPEEPPPGVVDLVTRSASLVSTSSASSPGNWRARRRARGRNVLPPAMAEKPLDSVGERVDRRVETARQREEVSRDDALRAVQSVMNQTIGAVLDMLDWDMLMQHVPLERVVANVDLGGVIRESTSGLAGETVDAVPRRMMVHLWICGSSTRFFVVSDRATSSCSDTT